MGLSTGSMWFASAGSTSSVAWLGIPLSPGAKQRRFATTSGTFAWASTSAGLQRAAVGSMSNQIAVGEQLEGGERRHRAVQFEEHFQGVGDVGFAGRQAMLGEQFGNGAVRRPLLAQLQDDFLGGKEVLEFLWPARCEFRDRSADGDWIKSGHRRELFWPGRCLSVAMA